MKNFKKIICIFISLFIIFPYLVNAATELHAGTQNPVVGEIVNVQLEANYGDKFNIRDFHIYIKYDQNYFELIDIVWVKKSNEIGTTKVENGLVYVDKTNANWSSGPILQLKLKVLKDGFTKLDIKRNGESYYTNGDVIAQTESGISINAVTPSTDTLIGSLEVEGYTLEPTFSRTRYEYNIKVPSNVSLINIKAKKGDSRQSITGVGEKYLEYGKNKFNVVVTAQNQSYRTYQITITREDDRTGDTTLKSLNISNATIEFSKDKTTYDVTVSKSVESVLITGRTTDPNATLNGTGTKSLNIGVNTFYLKVTSSSGKERTYTINITRSTEELDTNIKSSKLRYLKVNSLVLNLSENKKTFLYGVGKEFSELSITATPESKTANVEIKGNEKLQDGINLITITVTETNEEVTEYNLLVYKNPKNTILTSDINNINLITDTIFLEAEFNSHVIPSSVVQLLKTNHKSLYYNVVNLYNGLLYQTKISDNIEVKDLDITMTKISEGPLTYQTELPANIEVTIYLEEKFLNNSDIKIYSFNENNDYKLLTAGLKVQNGYVTFTTNGDKNYIFTTSELIPEKDIFEKFWESNKLIILSIITIFIIILLIITKTNKKRRKKEENEPLY